MKMMYRNDAGVAKSWQLLEESEHINKGSTEAMGSIKTWWMVLQ